MSTKERVNFGFANVIRIILIVVAVVLLAFGVFFVFRTRNLADQAFRDAKNVYLALSTADIEYYSQGKSIYDPTQYNGLSEGVTERVKVLVDNEGAYRVVSYDPREHRVTGMIYYNKNYYVMYSYTNGHSEWEVKYLMPIYTYKD